MMKTVEWIGTVAGGLSGHAVKYAVATFVVVTVARAMGVDI